MNIYLVEDPFNIYNEVMYHMQKRNNILDISGLSDLLFSANMFEQKSLYSPRKNITEFENWRVCFSTYGNSEECFVKFEDMSDSKNIIEFTFGISHDKTYSKAFRLISLTHNDKQIPEADSVREFFKRGNVKQAVNSLDIIEDYIKKVNFSEYVKQQTLIANENIQKLADSQHNLIPVQDNILEKDSQDNTIQTQIILPITKSVEENKNLPAQNLSTTLLENTVAPELKTQPQPINNSFIKKIRNLFFTDSSNLNNSKKP